LFLDVEAGGVRFVPGKKVLWNNFDDPPPQRGDQDWDICVAEIESWEDWQKVHQWIMSDSLQGYSSIVVDSLMELQEKMKMAKVDSPVQPRIQDWGMLLFELTQVIHDVRDAARQQGLSSSVFVAGSTDKNYTTIPMLQGQIADRITYKLDAFGYYVAKRDEHGVLRRVLQFVPDGDISAGHRLGNCIEEYIVDPDLEEMIPTVIERIKSTYMESY